MLIYAMGLAAALLTAIYMTRMMVYTFHGPNRSGEAERKHLAEAPWVMTGPLVVLGVLSAVGGYFNLPSFMGGVSQKMHHWLEPVTGASSLRITHGEEAHLALCTEYALIGSGDPDRHHRHGDRLRAPQAGGAGPEGPGTGGARHRTTCSSTSTSSTKPTTG